jgi:nucleotide-binding universal stress UspA family protein
MSDRARTLVVGFDGSPTARAALAWAAQRAGDGGSLYVVYAFDLPPDMLGGSTYQHAVSDHKEHGRNVLASLPDLPGVTVETELIGGHAARSIADVAQTRGADEIVVGSRGHSPLRGALGSTSHELLHRAPCPVVVIPPVS